MAKIIIIVFVLAVVMAVFTPIAAAKNKAALTPENYYGLENEFLTIHWAALKNNCGGKLFSILLAIRKAENGPAGFEFGVVAAKDTNLDTQARWAAATVVKNYQRWRDENENKVSDGGETVKNCSIKAFIHYLGEHYCPPSVDEVGNENWETNVWHWYQKFEAANAKS